MNGSRTNNSQIYDVDGNVCTTRPGKAYTDPESTPAKCNTYYGGLFDQSKSSTWGSSGDGASVGIISDDLKDSGNVSYGTDTFTLSSNISLEAYPFEIISGNSSKQATFLNLLGVGLNATILELLRSAGEIPSRVWSVYDGWLGTRDDQPSDGVVVLGGYDAAKVSGPNITIDFASNPTDTDANKRNCRLLVTIRNMELKFRNGTSSSMLPQDTSALSYCIFPDYQFISIIPDLWTNFLALTGSEDADRSVSPLSFWQNLVKADTA